MLMAAITLTLSTAEPALPPAFASPRELQQWLMHYHRRPRPELVVAALVALEEELPRHGSSLEAEAQRGGMRSFFGHVLAKSPAAVQAVEGHTTFAEGTRRFLVEALWRCGTGPCGAAMARLGADAPAPAPDVRTVPLDSASAVDDLWASYSATGDRAYVERVIAALPASAEPPPAPGSAAAAAVRSLAVNAIHDRVVLAECVAAVEGAEGDARDILDEIVRRARRLAGPSGS
ncbi:MAG TPA: hypothetical protein VMR21_09270 [Vicinamibacteria bacterium]|nr:hypothetical protein [Vicinamibacteria bacterium]